MAGKRRRGADDSIKLIDDGDTGPSSGTGTAAHTYTSLASSGPSSFALVTWNDGTARTLSSATWGGASCTIVFQANLSLGTEKVNVGFLYKSGAQSGDLVITFSGTVASSYVSVASLTNLQSSTAVDTDSFAAGSAGGGTTELTALTTPGAGGIRMAIAAKGNDTTAVGWTGATEVDDVDAGTYRHTTAYDYGDDSGTISTDIATGQDRVIGGVSMR